MIPSLFYLQFCRFSWYIDVCNALSCYKADNDAAAFYQALHAAGRADAAPTSQLLVAIGNTCGRILMVVGCWLAAISIFRTEFGFKQCDAFSNHHLQVLAGRAMTRVRQLRLRTDGDADRAYRRMPKQSVILQPSTTP